MNCLSGAAIVSLGTISWSQARDFLHSGFLVLLKEPIVLADVSSSGCGARGECLWEESGDWVMYSTDQSYALILVVSFL